MSKKVVLDYDPVSGQMVDATGCIVGTWVGVKSVESISIDKVIRLKSAGFSADEIIEMVKEGVLM